MSMTPLKGYILTRQRMDAPNSHHLIYSGISDSGPFEALFTTERPLFFILRSTLLTGLSLHDERKPVELTTFDGRPVDALYFKTQKALFRARKQMEETGIQTFESDIFSEERFLMERFVHGTVELSGPCTQKGNRLCFINPALRKADYTPHFTLLSLDIETGQKGQLYSIACHLKASKRDHRLVLMVDEKCCSEKPDREALDCKGEMLRFPDEKKLLSFFTEALCQMDPDILIGWHVIGFDLTFLEKKFREHGIRFAVGRDGSPPEIREVRKGVYRVEVRGRVVIDGPPSLRGAFYSFDNFRLETVATELLGKGKDIDESSDKVQEIERRFQNDKPALAKYNLKDCTLVTDIFEKTDLIDHLFKRSLISGLPMDRVGMSVAAFDFFMLPRIHRKGLVGINVKDVKGAGHAAGGFVFSEKPGLYNNVVVLDFKSLYPSIISTFHIDPVSRLKAEQKPEKSAMTPVGIAFSRTEHVLPQAIDTLMERRELAKKEKDTHLSQAVKILMNSFYGVMGTTGCRFYHPHLPSAITGTGQWTLKTTRDYLREKGYQVIYGDTDSLFVCLKPAETKEGAPAAQRLVTDVNIWLKRLIQDRFGLESKLELEFEKHFTRFFLPAIRGGGGSAKKRYAGVIEKKGTKELVITGLEFVRSDWTRFARNFQYDLFQKIFNDEDVKGWLKQVVSDLKAGQYDAELVYQKRLTKPPSEYTKVIPPHVRAALLLGNISKTRRESRYVMTLRGPIPEEFPHHDIDYSHYIEKQLKPIFDSVMMFFDTSYTDIMHGKQLDLF